MRAKLSSRGTTIYNYYRTDLHRVKAYTPTGTADTNGVVGDIRRDDDYLYVKRASGWGRAALNDF